MSNDLSPIDTMVLYRRDGSAGRRAMEVALTLLFARKVLETEPSQQQGKFFRRPARIRVTAAALDQISQEQLAVVVAALRNTGKPDAAMTTVEMWSRLQQTFSVGFAHYLRLHVWPALIRRGLAIERDTRVLGLFRRRVRELTPEGRSLQAQVQLAFSPARELPSLLKKNPDHVAEAILRLGPLALLLPETRAYAKPLSEVARARRVTTLHDALLEDPHWKGFDSTVDMDWIVAFDAVDCTVDCSGADGGGGDGGGGDGGGGGE